MRLEGESDSALWLCVGSVGGSALCILRTTRRGFFGAAVRYAVPMLVRVLVLDRASIATARSMHLPVTPIGAAAVCAAGLHQRRGRLNVIWHQRMERRRGRSPPPVSGAPHSPHLGTSNAELAFAGRRRCAELCELLRRRLGTGEDRAGRLTRCTCDDRDHVHVTVGRRRRLILAPSKNRGLDLAIAHPASGPSGACGGGPGCE